MTVVVSAENLGLVAAFEGFEAEQLVGLEHDWGLHAAPATATPAGAYRIVREVWSDEARSTRASVRLRDDGLVRVAGEASDALVNRAGVVRISPGGRGARVATYPAVRDRFAFEELIGAALIHAMALDGRVVVHGMAAEVSGAGVLAIGESMAGKSTLALALLHAGGRVVSDDFLRTARRREGVEVGALRRDLIVRDGSFSLIPADLRNRFSNGGGGSSRMVLRQTDAPECFAEAVTPDVVWVLDGRRACSWFAARKLSQAQALAAMLAATSPLFVTGRYAQERAKTLPILKTMVESARCFHVSLGPGLLRSPGLMVRRLLAHTRPGRG